MLFQHEESIYLQEICLKPSPLSASTHETCSPRTMSLRAAAKVTKNCRQKKVYTQIYVCPIHIYLLLLLASGNLGNPAWQVKAHRGFFLLLLTTCQKRGLAEQPSILMWLENIQERKGKSFPDIFLNVHSGTMLCAHMTEPQEAPVHLDFSPLFSTHCWVPNSYLLAYWTLTALRSWASFPPEPSHWLTGRAVLSSLRWDGSSLNASDSSQPR